MIFQIDEEWIYKNIQIAMFIAAAFVFVILFKIPAGYGKVKENSKYWTILGTVSNKTGWFLMEFPTMLYLVYYFTGDGLSNITGTVFLIVWMTHYVQRTFIFPFLLRGDNRMSVIVVIMGAVFNGANTYIQGRWLYVLSPDSMYDQSWLRTPQLILGVILFGFGWLTNILSDRTIRNLRKDHKDKNHYIPKGFMFEYVSCPNYLGEMLEWLAWAIMTWSLAGLIFFVWTFANLAPRAHYTHKWYQNKFGEEYNELNRKAFIPFIW